MDANGERFDIQLFIDSLTDDQFRVLWRYTARGGTDTREFWLSLLLACQSRVCGPGNARWGVQLFLDKEKDTR